MALALQRFDDVDAFEDCALPFLMEREAEHNLFLGICSQIRSGRYTDFYLNAVSDGGGVVGATFRTPPFQLGLSHVADTAALEVIARDVHDVFGSLPGVVATKSTARAFADVWKRIGVQRPTVAMEQRIYRATRAKAPDGVSGEMRDATGAERDLMIAWFNAFRDEVGGIMGDVAENVDLRLKGGPTGLAVWWDGEPVAIAGFGGPTPNGIRIGPVYTPPELRGRGYASAVTAALTQRLFDEGRRFVFLYTDLANPTSNSIYQKIGYEPVCDVDQYSFE